jgi:hypothetical protein
VGINYGTVIQQHFTGPSTRLPDAANSLDVPPADVGPADPAETAGTPPLPAARLRLDVARLRQITDTNIASIARSLTITAPEGPVALERDIASVVASTDGNTAVTGVAGAGKTVVLHGVATAAAKLGIDTVVLRSLDLQATAGQTRTELNLTHDLVEILTGWPGTAPGLLLIDGLDQTSGTDASVWLPNLADGLAGTRWRMVATVRIYDLRHGLPWQRMFAGEPIDRGHADPGLGRVRHVVVPDLMAGEILQLRAASAALARLLDTAPDRLRGLLMNPFNLDLAGQMLRAGVVLELSALRSRADLLAGYWIHRVGARLDRWSALRTVANSMVRDGRQFANPVELMPGASPEAVTDLGRINVLRELPTSPGHATGMIEFAHPVLFDYAVAMLALGDTSKPQSLAERLDEDPNLAIKVRPSVEYRLATVWRDYADRQPFWRLALSLASRTTGHLLAGSAAAAVAAGGVESLSDVLMLADACTGTTEGDHGRWDVGDARGLAFLMAAAIRKGSLIPEAFAVLAALVDYLARHAGETDDIDLAALAADLPRLTLATRPQELAPFMATHLVPAAVTSMEIVLADPADPRRARLAMIASLLLAHAAAADPDASRPAVVRLCTPDMLHALGIRAYIPLVERISDIARQDPGLAVDIGAVAFEYKETRDERTPLIASAIMAMSTSRKDELDGLRYMVGTAFGRLTEVNAAAAASLLLRALEASAESRGRFLRRGFPVPPHPRYESALEFSVGHGVLLTMAKALIDHLTLAAAAGTTHAELAAVPTEVADAVQQLTAGLRNSDVWQRLLVRAAVTDSPMLALALMPALRVPNLFAYPGTWIPAGHVARRLSPLLPIPERAELEAAIWNLVDAGDGPTDPDRANRLTQNRDMIIYSLPATMITDERIRQRRDELPDNALELMLPELREADLDDLHHGTWTAEPPEPNSAHDIQLRLSEISKQLSGEDDEARTQAERHLIDIWESVGPTPDPAEPSAAHGIDVTFPDVRLQAAKLLAHLPRTTPQSRLGSEVYSALRSNLPEPTATHASNERHDTWASDSTASWSTTPTNSAVEGIIALTNRPDWHASHDRELSALTAPILDSPNPVHRFLAIAALTRLYPEPDARFNEIQRRLDTESDPHVARRLFAMLSTFVPSRAQDVDAAIRRLADRPSWACASTHPAADDHTGSAEQRADIANVVTALAVVHDTPYARSVLEVWMTHPIDHPNRATQATAWMRSILNPTDTRLRVAQQRSFHFLQRTTDRLTADWAAAQQPDSSAAARQERLGSIIRVAENIGRQIYFASGAHDDQSGQTSERVGDMRQFCALAMPLLEHLANVRYPSVTHQIIQTLDHLRLARPRGALLTAAAIVTADTGYSYEPIALDTVHRLVTHYLAERRDLLLTDPTTMSAVRQMLEMYIRVGWDKAVQLAEELDELFS